jgi:signal transduction histidine kinase
LETGLAQRSDDNLAVKRTPRLPMQFLGASLIGIALILAAGFGIRSYLHSSTRDLPYHDSFSNEHAAEWTAFGGDWELRKGAMHNDSDERGAKLVTGSMYWHNYSIEADVMLPAVDGDAGLMIRSSDEEVGTDAYSGYYAGLRLQDDSLVLGRAGHGWVENSLKLQPGGVQVNQWYHLKILAYGCDIVAVVTSLPAGDAAGISVTDAHCLSSGRAGLRSYRSGGIWRNVVIKAATAQDIAIQAKLSTRAFSQSHQFSEHNFMEFLPSYPRGDLYTPRTSPDAQTIGNLRLDLSPVPRNATIRGSVILTSPVLYVEGSTGGVAVPRPVLSPSLRIGDQVEVTGRVVAGDFSSTLEQAKVQTLWEDTPIPPVTVSASQAATGAFDATFVEVEGRLISKHYGPNNTFILDMDAGSQSFSALLGRGRGDSVFEKLKPDSLLRMRGVCVVDDAFTQHLTPFDILLRSSDDIEVLRGPPLWSAGNIAALAIGLLLLALIANSVYHRVERWRLHAILEERERMAHEIHDTLAQSFAGIGFQIEAIRAGIPETLRLSHQQLDLASELVRHSHKEARQSVAILRHETHESGDLLSLLERSASRIVEGGGVEIITSSSGEVSPIPLRTTDTLYRIGQEAIANSIRHAHPSSIKIVMEFINSAVRLVIADDGCGFNPCVEPGNFGIRGMRKRAASISAELQIQSKPGEGSQVCVIAPLPPRITISSLPQHLWNVIRKQGTDAVSTGKSNPSSHY